MNVIEVMGPYQDELRAILAEQNPLPSHMDDSDHRVRYIAYDDDGRFVALTMSRRNVPHPPIFMCNARSVPTLLPSEELPDGQEGFDVWIEPVQVALVEYNGAVWRVDLHTSFELAGCPYRKTSNDFKRV
jgi:hypothetical protein